MSTTEEVVGLNVILMLSAGVANRARELSAVCQRYGTSSVLLNNSNMLPHLTLHQCPIVGGVPALKMKLLNMMSEDTLAETVSTEDAGLTVTMQHKFTGFMNAGVFWNARSTHQLRRLHAAVMHMMNELRQGYILPHHAPMLHQQDLVTAKQRTSLSTWGSPLAKNEYIPHVTLASMSTPSEVEAAISGLSDLTITSGDINFVAHEIAIAGIGPFGTCPEIYEKISLV